jgi:glycosyltransferase involved in cell wall biosynthesis
MKRIAFIATNESVPWGGSEHCWSAVAERFARGGVQVHVGIKDWGAPVKQIEYLRSVGCRIFYRSFSLTIPARIKRRLSVRNGYEWSHIHQVAAGADLIVISQGGNRDGLAWMEAARSQGLKYAVISQSANEQWWPIDSLGERLAECYEGAAAAYFVSEANLALTRLQLVTPLARGRVIRNPFNVRYDAQPPWPGDPSDSLSLASVARLDVVQKGQDLLIRVLDRPHWRARSVRVTLAGTGIREGALRKLAAHFNVSNLEFAGFVEDIEQLWSRHHALVLASRFEGMPLALVEAMLCGRPCVGTDVGGNRELIRDGVNGFLAKAPTVDLLDEAMNRAWENRLRLREMGEAAAKDVRQWVSPDPTGDFVRELEALAGSA